MASIKFCKMFESTAKSLALQHLLEKIGYGGITSILSFQDFFKRQINSQVGLSYIRLGLACLGKLGYTVLDWARLG
jgi:hypothetical protein